MLEKVVLACHDLVLQGTAVFQLIIDHVVVETNLQMFPWNKTLYLYTNTSNYKPSTHLFQRHRSGLYFELQRTSQPNTSESHNPLLIIQTAGEPKEL